MKKRLFAVLMSLALLVGQVGMDMPALAAEETTGEAVETTAPVTEATAAPVEEPSSGETTAPTEESAPEATAAPVEEPAPQETAVPSEDPAPEETAAPTDEPAPENTDAPEVTPQAPSEAEVTMAPEETAAPTDEPEATDAPYGATVTIDGTAQQFETLEEALAQAQLASKAVITLQKDVFVSMPLVLTAGNVTISGGHTISARDMNAIQVAGGRLTLADVAVQTSISEEMLKEHTYEQYDASALCAVVVRAGGELKVAGGQIQAAGDAIRSEGGKVTVSSGSFSSRHVALYAADPAVVELNGGSFAGDDAAVAVAQGKTVGELLGAGVSFVQEGAAVEDTSVDHLTGAVAVKVPDFGEMTFEEQWAAAKANGGTVTLRGDTAVSEQLVVGSGENVTLAGGEFVLSGETEGALLVVKDGGKLTVASGVITAGSGAAVTVEAGGQLEVAGGEITGVDYGVLAAGSVNITGGAITGQTYAVSVVGSAEEVNDEAIGADLPATVALGTHGAVTVSGGTFTSGYAALYAEDPMAVSLTGGVYIGGEAAVAVPGQLTVGEMLAEGYEYKQDGAVIEDVSADYLPGSVSVRAAAAGLGASVTIAGSTKEYDTIEEAWAAAAAADTATVTLLGDVAVSAPLALTAGHEITLAGGDYTVTGTGASVLNVSGGKLTVASGAVKGGDYAIRASSEATLTISGGDIIADRYGVTASASTLTISGGTITSGYTGVYITGGTAAISGGKVTGSSTEAAWGAIVTEGGVLTISGGEIAGTGDGSGVYADGGEIVFSAGTITGGANGLRAVNSGTITMSGGSVTGESYGVALATMASAEISGGEIGGNCGVRVNEATASITGGTITTDTYGVYVSNGTAVIDGETVIDSDYNGACLFGGVMNIVNGTIKGLGEESGWGIYVSSGLVVVDGGTIEGTRYGIQASDPTTVALGGGTFTGEYAVKTAEGSAVGVMLQSGCVFTQDEVQIEDVSGDGLAGTVSVLRIAEPKAARVLAGSTATEYDTVEEAWAAAKGNTATVQLLSNVETAEPLTVEEGEDITVTGAYMLQSTGESVFSVTGGKLTIAGGVLRGGETGVSTTAGTVYITGGTIQATGTGISAAGGTVQMSGGVVQADQYGLVNSNRSAATLTGGTIISPYNGVFMSSGTLNMSGGTVQCTGSDSGWAIYVRGGKVNVSGGTVAGVKYGIMTTVPRYVSLTGGSFQGTSAVATAQGTEVSSMLASGYRYLRSGSPVSGSSNTLAGPLTVARDPSATPTPRPTARPTTTARPSGSGSGTASGGSSSGSGDKKSPKTGDETSLLPWTLMLAASGCGLAYVASRRRRNRG